MPAKPRRDWYVAVGDVSGEFEGNPLSFEASTVYGPFTAGQAAELSELGDGFPHATHAVWIYKVDRSKRFAGLRTKLRKMIEEAAKDAAADAAAQAATRREIRGEDA